jgi:hypothetical protein
MTTGTRARDNPFATWRLHAIRFRAPSFSWEDLELRWACFHYRAAIVGPHGSGKTQLLEEFRTRLGEQGHSIKMLRLNVDQPQENQASYRQFLHNLQVTDTVLFDGAEQLGRYAWWRFQRRTKDCRGLLITTHRPGRLPVLIQCSASPELLEELLRELLTADADRWLPTARQLFRQHRGNLREVMRELYDQLATMTR